MHVIGKSWFTRPVLQNTYKDTGAVTLLWFWPGWRVRRGYIWWKYWMKLNFWAVALLGMGLTQFPIDKFAKHFLDNHHFCIPHRRHRCLRTNAKCKSTMDWTAEYNGDGNSGHSKRLSRIDVVDVDNFCLKMLSVDPPPVLKTLQPLVIMNQRILSSA